MEGTFSHFELRDRLGVGGMGEVYLARDERLGRDVAVKILSPRFAADAQRRERFLREARLAAGINHPNVATVHEVDECDGHLFFAMELIHGETLGARVRPGGLSRDELLDVAIPVVEGLAAAHRKGVVHRDLKPDNVMVDGQGQLKILDFGLSRSSDVDVAREERLTEERQIIGTPCYMSPEQVLGAEVDPRSDLFSLGVMLYELGTGARPFDGERSSEVLDAVLHDRPPSMTRINPSADPGIARLVEQLLEKDADRRPGSADEVLGTLRRIEAGSAPRRSARGRRWVAAVLLVAGLAAAARSLWPPESSAPPSRRLLAVLPFESIGPPENAYLADGITESINSRVASIPGLGVIARTSTLQYRGTSKPIQQIAAELGVDYLLEGTVQWEVDPGGRTAVRVTPRLIDAADSSQIFTAPFEGDVASAFAVQADIAERIARELRFTVTGMEARRGWTEDLEAYAAYTAAIDSESRGFRESDLAAVLAHLTRAIERDGGFAVAYAMRALSHLQMHWMHFDHTDERLALARQDIEAACSIVPDLPEARLAQAMDAYRVDLDYDRALALLESVIQQRPNSAQVWFSRGAVWRRKGNVELAAQNMAHAFVLDPRSAAIAANLAETYMLMRDFDAASELLDRALSITPDWGDLQFLRSLVLLSSRGDVEGAIAALDGAPRPWAPELIRYRSSLQAIQGDLEGAVESLEQIERPVDNQFGYAPPELAIGEVRLLQGEAELARAAFEAARLHLEDLIEGSPGDHRYGMALAKAYAGLGRREEALRAAERSYALMPVEKESYRGARQLHFLAEVCTVIGESDRAIAALERLLAIPSRMTAHRLRLELRWRPLRGHPRFEELTGE